MPFCDIHHRRPLHTGVINQAVWSAHDRRSVGLLVPGDSD